MKTFKNIQEIKAANKASGRFFFERDTLRYFDGRTHSKVYGGCYFVTSEKGPTGVRRFTVRVTQESGEIMTVGGFGGFGEYSTRHDAHLVARECGEEFERVGGAL